MIPKKIHYFWFGKNAKSQQIIEYIESWKRYFPDYEIIEWNEKNFDVNCCKYTQEAYEAKKYAFVSDYARLYVLYNYGGLYFDTDIEVCKPFEKLLENHKMVLGFEDHHYVLTAFMASEPKMKCIQELLQEYEKKHFIKDNGKFDTLPNPVIVTKVLEENGLITNGKKQYFQQKCVIYPYDYFAAFNIAKQKLEITSNTVCIHHCMGTWQTTKDKIKPLIKSIIVNIIGENKFERIKCYIKKNGEK